MHKLFLDSHRFPPPLSSVSRHKKSAEEKNENIAHGDYDELHKLLYCRTHTLAPRYTRSIRIIPHFPFRFAITFFRLFLSVSLSLGSGNTMEKFYVFERIAVVCAHYFSLSPQNAHKNGKL